MLGNYLDKFVFEVEHLVTFVATYDVCCFVVFVYFLLSSQ